MSYCDLSSSVSPLPFSLNDISLTTCPKLKLLGLLRVSEYSDIHRSDYKIAYEYSSLPKSFDRNLFFFL